MVLGGAYDLPPLEIRIATLPAHGYGRSGCCFELMTAWRLRIPLNNLRSEPRRRRERRTLARLRTRQRRRLRQQPSSLRRENLWANTYSSSSIHSALSIGILE